MIACDRARAYLNKLPGAISGQGGHAATFHAACRLVEFGLDEESALVLLTKWNVTHCRPPWPESQLRHKLADAFRTTNPRREFAQRTAGRLSPSSHPIARPSIATPGPKRPLLETPTWSEGTAEERLKLASVRSVSVEAIGLAVARGLVKFGIHRGHRVWFITDGARRAISARRLDGVTWLAGVKALNLPGSKAAWPVGIKEARPYPVILLIEGGPDLLAALHLILEEGRVETCAPVAILSAVHSLPAETLELFQGKRVRIFAHAEEAGLHAADRWSKQLQAAGASADVLSFAGVCSPDGRAVNDLNDFVRWKRSPGAGLSLGSILP